MSCVESERKFVTFVSSPESARGAVLPDNNEAVNACTA